MAQDALLAQIKKLFEEEREQTRKLVREEVEAGEKRLRTLPEITFTRSASSQQAESYNSIQDEKKLRRDEPV